jgi:DNA-binding IscR family transcriptional regulator
MIKTQFETAVILLTMLAANPNTILNSLEMADRCGKNDGVVRSFMISLGDAGLILSQRGSSGGWMLARDPKAITLEDIYRAVFEGHSLPSCPSDLFRVPPRGYPQSSSARRPSHKSATS